MDANTPRSRGHGTRQKELKLVHAASSALGRAVRFGGGVRVRQHGVAIYVSIPTAVALLDEGTPRLIATSLIEARCSVPHPRGGGHHYTVSVCHLPDSDVGRGAASPIAAAAPRRGASRRHAETATHEDAPPDGEPVIHLYSWTEALITSAIVAARGLDVQHRASS
jgi:hypothetical protein